MPIESIIEESNTQDSPVEYQIVVVPSTSNLAEAKQLRNKFLKPELEEPNWRYVKKEPKAIETRPTALQVYEEPYYNDWRFVDEKTQASERPHKEAYYDNWRFKDDQFQIADNQPPKEQKKEQHQKHEIITTEKPHTNTINPEPEIVTEEPEIDRAEPSQMEIYLAKMAQFESLRQKSNPAVQQHIGALLASPTWQQLEYDSKIELTSKNIQMMTTCINSVLDFYENPEASEKIVEKRFNDAMTKAKILMAQNPHLEQNPQFETNLARMGFLQARHLTHSSRFFEFMVCLEEFEKMVDEKNFTKFSVNRLINEHEARSNRERVFAEAQKNNVKMIEILRKNAKGIQRILKGEEGYHDPMALAELGNTMNILISGLRKKETGETLQTEDLVMAVDTTLGLKLFFENTPEFKKFMTQEYSKIAKRFEFVKNFGTAINPELINEFETLRPMLKNNIARDGEFSKIRNFFEIKQKISIAYTAVLNSQPQHRRQAENANNTNFRDRNSNRSNNHRSNQRPNNHHKKNPNRQRQTA